jgi:hypothetical protein
VIFNVHSLKIFVGFIFELCQFILCQQYRYRWLCSLLSPKCLLENQFRQEIYITNSSIVLGGSSNAEFSSKKPMEIEKLFISQQSPTPQHQTKSDQVHSQLLFISLYHKSYYLSMSYLKFHLDMT